ncbi:MAG: hypothetical protein COV66_12090 [Nitrospinae bacterium CG11_big_fil_rev_8_21_14_0_20_45_15]|nr:MAG: hypothetical protein COV66_12090 [Nitrospinae bacterium CG11_big_fil_rev_8_21_14_0_20_45_15]
MQNKAVKFIEEHAEPMDNNDTGSSDPRIESLNAKVENLARDIETIKKTLHIRKTENITLRIILYTGLTVLLVGFIFFSRTVQQAQLENMDSTLASMQNRINLDMISFQRELLKEVALIKKMRVELDASKEKTPAEGE